jgi:outer membrane protein assembly factor BamB
LSLLDTTHLDFSRARLPGETGAARKTFSVRNNDRTAVLHVGIRAAVPWIEAYPLEFALGPGVSQTVIVEMRPERAGDRALAAAKISLYGQYLAVSAARAESLPPDVTADITLTPPISDCPTCGTLLPEGIQECRRCGERIRLCPACATPNTWLAHVCRTDGSHIIRPESDWIASPGGTAIHRGQCLQTPGKNLARRWSSPGFPPTRSTEALEWSAPLAAFGMVMASAIDSARERAMVSAMAMENGAPLWELDLPDKRGLYPDRGGMAVSPTDGLLYAATLGGSVIAIDSIRGTLKWTATVPGTVYGAVILSGDFLLIPADDALYALDRKTGKQQTSLTQENGRFDTAPAAKDGLIVGVSDAGWVTAFTLGAEPRWSVQLDGGFDAAPMIHGDSVIVATLAGEIACLALADGTVRWRVTASTRAIAATPAVSSDGLLYAGADDGMIHIVAADTGHLIRSRRVSESPIRTAPVVCGQTVFVGADDGSLYTLDQDYNIARAYETTPGARISCAGLAVYGDNLIAPATNGVLYVLRITG